MAVQTQIQTRRGTAASWTSTNPTLAAGEFGYETDTGKFKIGNGSTAWASLAYTAAATAVTYLFNATAAQTTFSGADANGLTLAYTVGAEQVYLNGVLQVRGSDYTATNGTSIVLASGALTSDVLNVIAYSAMTVTDTYTQAQADAKFVQQTNNFFAGKNKIINGDFNIWQRGTSFSNPSANSYTADRFLISHDGTGATRTITRQAFTPGTAPVAGYEGNYFYRYAFTAVGTGNSYCTVAVQRIEDVTTFAGQTVTISFWAKNDTSKAFNVYYNQAFGSGGSGSVSSNSAVTIGTSWARYSVTFAIPSIAGKTIGTSSYLEFYIADVAGTRSTFTFDTWGWQVEAGSIATPFQTATGTLAGELAACQRYLPAITTTSVGEIGTGFNVSTTQPFITIPFQVPARVAPTGITATAANYQARNAAGSGITLTAIAFNNASPTACAVLGTVASGLVAGNGTSMQLNGTILFTGCEL